MRILVGFIVALFFSLVFAFKKVWAYLDLDPETCSFNTASMLPEYKDPGTLQYFGKILENTGYNWRQSGQAMLLENELILAGGQKTYDTGRDYDGSYVMLLIDAHATESRALPFTIYPATYVRPTFLLLTTTYQEEFVGSAFEIRAVSTGGYSIYNNSPLTSYRTTGMIIELRKVTGA